MEVGSRVYLHGLRKEELNGKTGVVVSQQHDRLAVELQEADQRIAIKPCNLEPICEPSSSLAVHAKVAIKGLAGRVELNGRLGEVIAAPEAGKDRWGVKVGSQRIAVRDSNLSVLACFPNLDAPATRPALHRHDLVLLRFAANHGVDSLTFPEDRAALWPAACLRQSLLYTWGTLPSRPADCVNVALAPTLVFGCLAVDPLVELGSVLRVHCIGATADFEGCADWGGLGELLEAAGLQVPSSVEITHFGNDQAFALPPGIRSWSAMKKKFTYANTVITVRQLDELYHSRERAAPDVALLCHPGFDNYKEIWLPTMSTLFRMNIPVTVAGHSNFFVSTHDAIMHQDVGLRAMGANLTRSQLFNPFCQAYLDPTKGSLLATQENNNKHCNLAWISVFCGGEMKAPAEIDSFFDVLDYLGVSVQGFPFGATGPTLHGGPLRLKYPHMTDDERKTAVQLLSNSEPAEFPTTAPRLKKLLEERGLARHYNRGRGNW